MKFSLEQLRQIRATFPNIRKASHLAKLTLLANQVERTEISDSDWLNLRKNCWDILNRDPLDSTLFKHENFQVKVLILDVETAPLRTYVWRRWGQDVHSDMVLDDNWPILTWSAKWLFDPEILNMKMTPEEALKRADRRLVIGLKELLEEADVVIAHNGLKFDMRIINARMWINGLTPPSSYQVIDTLKAAKRAMALPSYKLDDLAQYSGNDRKIKTDFTWWTEFLEGKQEAIDRMCKYNDKDVKILEEVYISLRPWIKPHPNIGLYISEDIQCCPTCASTNILPTGNRYATYVNLYEEIKCHDCGAISRSRKNGNLRDRSELLVSLPK